MMEDELYDLRIEVANMYWTVKRQERLNEPYPTSWKRKKKKLDGYNYRSLKNFRRLLMPEYVIIKAQES